MSAEEVSQPHPLFPLLLLIDLAESKWGGLLSPRYKHDTPQGPVFQQDLPALSEGLLSMSAGGLVQPVQKVSGYLHEVSGRRRGAGPHTGHQTS